MDIIISAHFCPMRWCRFAGVYKSDNILSVWGLEEEEEEKKKQGIFSYLYLWDACRKAGNAMWQFTCLNTQEER